MEENLKILLPSTKNLNEMFTSYPYILLDIGCGNGDYILSRIKDEPNTLFIGIELYHKRAKKTFDRLYKRHFENFIVFEMDAQRAIRSFFAEETLDEVHVNFPDPWLKKKQWKNRLLRASLIADISYILKINGKLYFVSDIEEYALYASTQFALFKEFENKQEKLLMKNLYPTFPTLFYDKMHSLRDINYVFYQKKEASLL